MISYTHTRAVTLGPIVLLLRQHTDSDAITNFTIRETQRAAARQGCACPFDLLPGRADSRRIITSLKFQTNLHYTKLE